MVNLIIFLILMGQLNKSLNCGLVAKQGNVNIRIAQNLPDPNQPNLDTEDLSIYDSVEVRSLNFSALMGAGILHTKLWIVDR